MTAAHVDIALHEDAQPHAFRLLRRDDGAVVVDGAGTTVRVTELLLAEDAGTNRDAIDELLGAIRAVVRGDREMVDLGFDATELEVRAESTLVRPVADVGEWAWTEVPTRELHDALLALHRLVVGA